MAVTSDPVTLVAGQPAQIPMPGRAPALLQRVKLDNQSPLLCEVVSGTLTTWLQPWSSDVFPAPASGQGVTLKPQTPPALQTGGGSTSYVTATWYDATDLLTGAFPAQLNAQVALAAGKQHVAFDSAFGTAVGGGDSTTFPLDLIDRSAVILVQPLAIRSAANAPTTAVIEVLVGGVDSQTLYLDERRVVQDPALGIVTQAPLLAPMYGTADSAVQLDLFAYVDTESANPPAATVNLQWLVLTMPEALLLGVGYAPAVVEIACADRAANVALGAGPAAGNLLPLLHRPIHLHTMSVSTGGAAGAGGLVVTDALGNRLYGSSLGTVHPPYDFCGLELEPGATPLVVSTTAGAPVTVVTMLYR